MLKKAAMFGLDARIALAIFGALSVISGAALYSAIQDAKTTSMITEMQEIGKAWEAYYLDVGENIPRRDSSSTSSANYYLYSISNLVSSSKINWKGPYLSYSVNTYHLEHDKYNNIYMLEASDGVAWGDSVSWYPTGACTSGKKCFVWIMINGLTNLESIKNLDKKIDGSDGINLGDFRWAYDSGNSFYAIYYKYSPIKNPND
jgi:hypothetical protein